MEGGGGGGGNLVHHFKRKVNPITLCIEETLLLHRIQDIENDH